MPNRAVCAGLLLVVAAASPACAAKTVSHEHAVNRHRKPARRAAKLSRRHGPRGPQRNRARLVLASARIPQWHFAVAYTTAPQSSEPAPRFEQRLPRQAAPKTAALQGIVRDTSSRAIPGVVVAITNRATGFTRTLSTDADGVFRWPDLTPGTYLLSAQRDGYTPARRDDLPINAGDVISIELTLAPAAAPAAGISRLPRIAELGPALPAAAAGPAPSPHRELRRRPDELPGAEPIVPEVLPPRQEVFTEAPDRWNVSMPRWDRYGHGGEYPYVPPSHWWDPFHRNRLKGDEPIFGQQTFLKITGVSDTFADERHVPQASNISSARPGSAAFFGKGQEFALDQTFRFSFDLFHGDASFRPVDWRIQITPAINVNYLDASELGIVNVDVRDGTTRLDSHAGLQEAFFEYKLADLSSNYDFLSVRAGIQGFTSDFRGFIFADEEPGLRLFGNLRSDRVEYNAAYFNMLEKDTNSGLNSLALRHQQVIIGNVYLQDFGKPGYTTEFSIHYNKDDPSVFYDSNGFLQRPAPVGVFQAHEVRVAYLGWAGNGHFGRMNVNHAFYEALGTDSVNPIAGRPVTINAQMGAAEVSVDHDWQRYKISAFYASGDGNPRGDRATGFDSITDDADFAGGIFSFWDREQLRLPGTGLALTSPNSLLPNLRTSNLQGQANFVNPGIFILNAGATFDLTTKLKSFLNANYLRFENTAPLELLLFESPIHNTIGLDYSLGFEYRPPLSENIVLTGGAAALSPGQGFRDLYGGATQFSLFGNVRFQF